MNLEKLLRPNILQLQPYSCARDEFKGEASVYLDANESPFNAPLNRYPDPLQWKLKEQISVVKKVLVENIFIGNGSDEPIDLLFRAFCEPRVDNVVAIEPTYGMYKVCAGINDVEYRKVLLDENFNLSADKLLDACNLNTKIIWLCSPNNPTGNSLKRKEIEKILGSFDGIVVLDEAYIDFSMEESQTHQLSNYPNLVILQTLSKAWGSAGIRLGMAFASTEIVGVLNKIKYPYNINILTQKKALSILKNSGQVNKWTKMLLSQRWEMEKRLMDYPFVQKVYPSDANFVLVKVDNADKLYHFLVEKSVIIRNRNTVTLCSGCVRITIGSPDENVVLLSFLSEFKTA
jgi:histidinol-phosphate aminotransferase